MTHKRHWLCTAAMVLMPVSTPMTTAQIAIIIMLAKGYPADDDALKAVMIETVPTVLRRLCKDGSVIKFGTTQDAQWTLAPSLL
jgi:hypothetical protein